jgi:Rod binding domain-containing protein
MTLAPSASTTAAPPASTVTPQVRARIEKTAHSFEASFLSVMLGEMFQGVSAGSFGGGEGEEAFKSLLTDSMAKAVANRGGIGLSNRIAQEMLRMQGLSRGAAA